MGLYSSKEDFALCPSTPEQVERVRDLIRLWDYTRDDAEELMAKLGVAEPKPESEPNEKSNCCLHGHEWTPENTGRKGNGWRYCRACNHAAERRRRALRRRANG